MPTKLTGTQAGLLFVGQGARCGNCAWFWETKERCTLVRGRITADLCCNGWTAEGQPTRYDFDSGEKFRNLIASLDAADREALREE